MAVIGGLFFVSIVVIGIGIIGYSEFRENFPIVLSVVIVGFMTVHKLVSTPSFLSNPLNYELNKYHYLYLAKTWGIVIVFSLIYKISLYIIRNSNED